MLVFALAMTPPMAMAAQLPIDGGWTILESPDEVSVPTPGSPYVFEGGPWEMNPITAVKLTVTDLYWSGDLFEVWNNGSLLGSGSAINSLSLFASTPDAALGNASFSQNSWTLQPGAYSLLFKSTKFASPYKNTQLAFKVESVHVPDGGATFLLLGMAFTGIAGIRRLL
jgi:hypothetical protein